MSVAKLLRAVGDVEKATLVRELEGASNYRFEIKYDGYRILAVKSGGDVRLMSRNGKDWTAHFPTVAAAVAKLPADDLVLDGEVCALEESGRPSFNLLQNQFGGGKTTLSYPVFDVLFIGGRDVRSEPLEARLAILAPLLAKAKGPLALSSTIELGKGDDWRTLLQTICAQGLEGVIAKRKGSKYLSGRTKDWLKLKCTHRQEFAIVGYLPLINTTDRVGALLLAIATPEGFRFAGKVGTGFDNAARKAIAEKLDARRVDTPPAKDAPRIRVAHWTEPKLVGEVEFTEWTPDGKVRHPSFLGLRADKSPRDCTREVAVTVTKTAKPSTKKTAKTTAKRATKTKSSTTTKSVRRDPAKTARVTVSNASKILFPRDGLTKGDVVAYYRAVSDVMVPHLAGRPLALQRWPNGIDGEAWFQQKAPAGAPDFVRLIPVDDRLHVSVDHRDALLWLANLAALTLHQWSSHAPVVKGTSAKARAQIDAALDRPDYVVFDLDPGDGTWANLVSIAKRVRKLLDALDLESVVKTSGKRGLHIVVPIAPERSHEEAAAFAGRIADAVADSLPEIATTERMKAKRKGRLYVDWLQNGRGKTIVAPYTLRAIDGAPVSCPIAWSEVSEKLDPSKLGMRAVLKRIEKHGDLFAPVLSGTARLPRE